MSFHLFVPGLLVVVLFAPSLSQTVCSSTLTGTFANVSVNGSSCILRGATVQMLFVVDGGSLRTVGASQIVSMVARNAGNVDLLGKTTVLGAISFMNSGNLTIGPQARGFEIVMEDSGVLKLRGSLISLHSRRSGKVIIKSGVVNRTSPLSMFISRGNPNIQLCGATIGHARLLNMPASIFSSNSSLCQPSSIRSLLLVQPTLSIAVTGVNILETFSTIENFEVRVQNMSLTSTNIAGEVTVENVAQVSFTSVRTDQTVSLSNVPATKISNSVLRGDVNIGASPEESLVTAQQPLSSTIIRSVVEGDVKFGSFSGEVYITRSEFSNKSVEIETQSGAVVFNGNYNLDLTVRGNSVGATILLNRIRNGIISDNEGPISLISNKFETLSCSGNDPSPLVSENVIANGGSGQCASA